MATTNLHTGSPLLGDILTAIENLQNGIKVGVRDQTGAIYRIDTAFYDSNRMALVFQIDTTAPVVLPVV